MSLLKAKEVARAAYDASAELMADPEYAGVVSHGLSICYGPVKWKPDLALVTFQGGGADKTVQKEPPTEFLYAKDPYKFGAAVRRYSQEAGILEVIQSNAVAHPVVFPQGPTAESGKWMARSGPRSTWRNLSLDHLGKLLSAQAPKVVMVFGTKASELLEIDWEDGVNNHPQGHLTFGLGKILGIPAVYCHHLSIGCPADEARRCFGAVSDLMKS